MNAQDTQALNEYLTNRLTNKRVPQEPDESLISSWETWLASESPSDILNVHVSSKRPVNFREPQDIVIMIHESIAGKIPVVILGNDSDFEDLITNLAYHGERPENISEMGASFMYGRNLEFLILSKKFYSNTPPEIVKLTREDWRHKSMILRLEHECVHQYTRKFYGSATNNIHDELIADFFGIRKALGRYSASLFGYFMGIDGSHDGRLSLYTSGLSPDVTAAIAESARGCAEFLESWQDSESFGLLDEASRIDYLCVLGVQGMLKSRKAV